MATGDHVMKAHVVEAGIIVNTIEVESLDFMEGLVDASLGGSIGDTIEVPENSPETENKGEADGNAATD